MAWTPTNLVTVGSATRKLDYDRLWSNAQAVKEARSEHALGGDYVTNSTSVSYVPIPAQITVEIDGTNLGGLVAEVQAMCKVVAGSSAFFQLFNLTTATAVAGTETSFTLSSNTFIQSAGVTLEPGIHRYRLDVRVAAGGGICCVYGAKLVIR